MTFEEAARLSLVFFVAGGLSYLLVRLFAGAARRRGANALSMLERADALGTGPIGGRRQVTEDDFQVLRLLLRHAPDRWLEGLRLLAWLAIAVTADVFVVLAGPGDGRSFWLVLAGFAACSWIAELVNAIRRRDAAHAWRSAIVAGFMLLGIAGLGGLPHSR